jgi:hypothetical protein
MSIAIGAAVAFMALAAVVYFLVVSKGPAATFNGAAIVAAARAYTHDLQSRKQPVPASVSLEDLAAQHFLKPEEIEAFRGAKAVVALTGDARDPRSVIMRVHFPDGGDFVLLADGSVQEVAQGH